jgi:hypothetical protein
MNGIATQSLKGKDVSSITFSVFDTPPVPAGSPFLNFPLASSLQMPHRIVAAQASELPAAQCRVHCFNSADNFLMTRPARLLGDLPAVRFDLNIVLVTARGEEK